MDFPVCPACGQSVIDDDAEDCPFCGSSMKAKPGTKPSAAKPSAAKPVAAKAVTGTSSKNTPVPAPASAVKPGAAAGSRPGGKPGPADDFPFEAELPGGKSAIQAMPNPSKGRSLQVVCPMCETAGYVAPTAVGKEVKCANAKCMVPIFKVPAATVEAPKPPPPKKSNLMLVGGITIALMVAIGGGAIFVSGMAGGGKTAPPGGLTDEAKELIAESTRTKPAIPKGDGTKPKEEEIVLPEENKKGDTVPKTPEEFFAAAQKQLNESCLKGDTRQRSKPLCRQLAADACIRVGDVKAASEHLAQLIIVGPSVPYYRIEPSLELFWNAWIAGDKATATKILNAALVDSQKLPQVGRSQMEVASKLAAALVVAGRIPDAQQILKNHQSSKSEGQLSARVQMASDARVTRVSMSQSVLPWTSPQAVAVTASLVARKQLPAGLSWAKEQADEESKTECLTVWAEGAAFQQPKPGPASSNAELVDAITGLPPALAARVWARAACGRFAAGDQEGAAATLKAATDLLAQVPVPPEPVVPEIKPAINFKLPAAAPLVQAATTAAEISFTHSLWPDHIQQADDALELALSFARGIAPALPAVAAKLQHADQAGSSGLQALMKKELGLKNDDQATQNAQKYRKVLIDLRNGANRRLDLQVEIMSRLSEVGSKNKVWSVVSNRSGETNSNRRDEFLGTRLTGELIEAFRGSEIEKEILGAAGSAPARPDGAVVKDLLQQSPPRAAQFVSSLDTDSVRRDEMALQFATHLAATEKGDVAIEFISRLKDIVLREEAYRLVAALLAQRGHANKVWTQMVIVQNATEKAALCRGLVVGLKAGAPQKELPQHVLAP